MNEDEMRQKERQENCCCPLCADPEGHASWCELGRMDDQLASEESARRVLAELVAEAVGACPLSQEVKKADAICKHDDCDDDVARCWELWALAQG